MGLRAGLDTEARGKILSPLPGIEPQSPGRPAHSQTLYCLSYPGSPRGIYTTTNQRPILSPRWPTTFNIYHYKLRLNQNGP
jgi:hypothetical protein